MNTKNTNWLAIVVSAIVNMALGMLWYGYLFMDKWMAGNNITMSGDKMFKNGVEMDMSYTPMIVNTIAMFAYPIFMNWVINKTGDTTAVKGATLGAAFGLINWLGILVGNMFAGNAMSLSIGDGLYSFLVWVIIGAIIGGWRKKQTT